MNLIAFSNGELEIRNKEGLEFRYLRIVGNQLINSARMGNWDQFTKMWKHKTNADIWIRIEPTLTSLNVQEKWKVKEAFARLTTQDTESNEAEPTILSDVVLC